MPGTLSRWPLAAALSLVAAAATAESLTLEACIERALEHNTLVRSAEQGVRRSQADVQSARARRLPSVSATLLNASHARTGASIRVQENPTGDVDPETGQRIFVEETTQIPGIDRNSYGLSAGLSHTLYDGGEGRQAHAATQAARTAAELQLRARRAEVVFRAKQRYFDLLKAQELVEVQAGTLELSRQRLEEARARLEVGATTRVDVLRLQVDAENAAAAHINAEQQVALARAGLNHVMGRSLAQPLTTVAVGPQVPSRRFLPPAGSGAQDTRAAMERLARRARELSPELEALRRSERAAELSLDAARAAWHPTVSASASYSRNNEVFDRVYGDLDRNYRLNAGVSVSYNLFDGGLRSAGIRRSRAGLRTAQLTVEQQERDLALAVETAFVEMVRLDRILAIAERTTELADEDLRLAEQRYRVGKGRLLEVLDAQVSRTEAASNRVSTRYDLAVAEADLERLVGEAP